MYLYKIQISISQNKFIREFNNYSSKKKKNQKKQISVYDHPNTYTHTYKHKTKQIMPSLFPNDQMNKNVFLFFISSLLSVHVAVVTNLNWILF